MNYFFILALISTVLDMKMLKKDINFTFTFTKSLPNVCPIPSKFLQLLFELAKKTNFVHKRAKSWMEACKTQLVGGKFENFHNEISWNLIKSIFH